MPDQPEEPGLLDRAENGLAAQSDEYRASLPPDQRTSYDAQVGAVKGTYGFVKDQVSNLIDLTTFAEKLRMGDPQAWGSVGQKAWDVTKTVAKSFYYEYIASSEEKAQYEKEINDKIVALYQRIKDSAVKQWQDAKAQGKEAELLSKWGTRGVLEILPFLIGAGEMEAASEASKLSKTAKVVGGTCDALEAEKAAAAAKKAEQAVALAKAEAIDAGKAAKSAEQVDQALAASKDAKAIPKFQVSKKEFPGHARVIENAAEEGKPLKLTRLEDKKAIRRNRRRSQRPIRKAKGGPPPRMDYDEFPYASTHEGGTGAHVEPNVSTDNQGAGRALGKFYRDNNIKEGDTFEVEVKD